MPKYKLTYKMPSGFLKIINRDIPYPIEEVRECIGTSLLDVELSTPLINPKNPNNDSGPNSSIYTGTKEAERLEPGQIGRAD